MGDYEPRGNTDDYDRRQKASSQTPEEPPAESHGNEPAGGSPPPPPPEQTVEGEDGYPVPSKDDRTWALFSHLGGMLLSIGGGFGFIVPLVIWIVKKDDSAFVDDQSKEALNFQLTILLFFLGFLVLTAVTCGVAAAVGWPLLILVVVAEIVLGIIAAIKSYDGERYRYPVCIRLLK